jgi:hypothetical protein
MNSIQLFLLLRIIGQEFALTVLKSCLQSGNSDWFLHVRIKQSGRIISLSSMILKLILRHRGECHQLCVRQVKGSRLLLVPETASCLETVKDRHV